MRHIGRAILAGMASALLFIPSLMGHPVGLMLAYLTPLPLMVAGLAWGRQALLVSMGAAGVVIFAAAGNLVVPFAFIALLPAAVVVLLGLLVRTHPDGRQEWFPLGGIVGGLSMVAAFTLVLVLGLVETAAESSLQSQIALWLGQEVIGRMPFGLDAQAREMVVQIGAWALPAMFAIIWTVSAVINGVLAQSLVVRWNKALRPLPSWSRWHLSDAPAVVVVVSAVVLAFTGLDTKAGYAALNVMLAMVIAFFLQGLAQIHGWAQQSAYGTVWLVGVYLLLLFVFAWMVIAVTGVGLFQFFALKIRRRASVGGVEE